MLTTFSTSVSFVTLQWTKEVDEEERWLERELPKSSRMSAITTFAPGLKKCFAMDSPIPLAPPVIIAALPSSLTYSAPNV